MISIVLYKPEQPGNIGAIARVMENFGFDRLVLVEPACDPLADEALHRATHAKDILRKAKVVRADALGKFDTLIGTTAQLGRDYSVSRSPITPKMLAELPLTGNVGLLFGPEAHGLSNAEVQQCDVVVTIPSNIASPTLNLSHAVAIVLYELSQRSAMPKIGGHVRYAGAAEKTQVLNILSSTLAKLDFRTAEKRETQRKVWKRLLGKSFLTRREALALMGFLKKIK